MQQPPQQVISSSQVFNKNEFYQKGFLTQSQISQTPHGIHQVTTTEYPKDSTIVKLISSNAPGAVTQVSPSFQVQSRIRTNQRHSTPPGHSRTIIRHSESPIRYVTESISPGRTTTYQDRQIPVAAVVKEQIPLYIIEQQRQPVQIQERVVEVEKPIYIEKIVEIASDSSVQVKQLSERILILEQNNRQLTLELEHYRNQGTQVVQVENTDKINELQRELERQNDENEKRKRSQRQNESEILKANQDKERNDQRTRELLLQIEQLNALLNEKQQEIGNLTIKVTQIQNSEVRNSDARAADHLSKINMLTQEIDRLTKQMKLSREQYDEDMQKLQAQIQARNREVEEWRLKFTQVNNKVQDYEARFVFLNAELERLRANQSDNARIRELEIIIQQKDAQLNEWKIRFAEMEKAMAIYKQYESKLYECETVNAQLRKKIDELMQANRRNAEIEALQAENQSLQIKIRQLLEQVDTLNALVQQKDAELQRLKLEINHLTINVRQSGVNQQEEINRLNELVLQRNREIEDLRRKFAEIDLLNQRVRAYEERIREQEALIIQLQRTIEDLKQQLDTNERVKKSAKSDNKGLEDKIVQLSTQNQFLQTRINALEAELQQARQRIIELEQSGSRVLIFEQRIREQETLILQLQRTIEEMKQQLDEAERVKRSSKNNNQVNEEKLGQMTVQINFFQTRVNQLEQELAAARKRIAELEQSGSRVLIFEQRIREQETLIIQLQRTIEEMKQQLDEAERVKRSSKNNNQAAENQIGQLTIQINMVNQENERLKEQLRARDDELNKLRLQVQQLNINITQLGGSRDELIRLQELLNRRNAEYEDLARKYSQYSQYEIKLQECEMNNVQLRKRIDDLLQDSVKKASRISELELQLRESGSLQEKLINATQTIEVLQRRIVGLEQESNQYRLRISELENASRTIQELEIRIRSLIENNERLTQLVAQKDAELQKLRAEVGQLNIRINQVGVSSEELNMRIREIESLKSRIRELEQQLINFRTFEARYAELEQVNAQLRAQIENLQRQIADLTNQANDERVKKSRQQGSLEDALRDRKGLEEKLVHMTTQIDFMQRKIQSLEQELANLRQRNAQLESASLTITQLEGRAQQLTITIERLNQLIAEKDQEINRLRQENGNLQINIRQSGVNQDEVLRLRREIEEQRRLLNEKETIILQLRPFQDKLAECERNNAELRARIEQLLGQYNDEQVKRSRVNANADQAAREKALLEQQISQLNITIENLNKRQILLDQELQKLRLRNSELENATRSSGTYEIKITALTEEVSKLRALLAQRDNELNQLRLEIQQLHLSTRQSTVIQQEVSRLQEALSKANRENEELKSRIREMEMIILQLQQREQRIKDLENENAQLRRRLEEALGQANEERVKKSQRDNRSDQELAELRAKLTEATNSNQKLVFENTRLSEQLQIVAKDNEKLRQTIIQLEQTLASFKQFELKVQQYERTIAELRQRIEELIIQLNEANEDRVKKSRQNQDLEGKLRLIQQYEEKIALLVQQNEALQLKIRQLESQLIQLQQYASLAQQNEQLVVRIRSLEQEISSYRLVIENIRRQLIEWEATFAKIQGYNSLVEVVKQSLTQIQVVTSSSVVRYSTQVLKN